MTSRGKEGNMIQRRSMGKQVLLFIVTVGLYGIYWYYVTVKEMLEYKRLDGSPGLWTILLFIPIVNLYSYWKYGETLYAVTDGKYPAVLILILWLFFSPAVWFLAQMELNRIADREASQLHQAGVREVEASRGDQQIGEESQG